MPFRKLLLVLFGAQLGRTWIHPSTRIWAPWLLKSGDDVFIDRDCDLYNAYGIEIGNRVVISQSAFLCTASHDHTISDFPLIGGPIRVGSGSWIAIQALVLPGIHLGANCVVGARSVVTRDVDPSTVVAGNPAKPIGPRQMKKDS